MNKLIRIIACCIFIICMAGCSQQAGSNARNEQPKTTAAKNTDDIDLDLTKLSGTMVYAEVYNMMTAPESYIGKTVKMSGQFAVWQGTYFACVIADATACCQQGIEFERKGNHVYPDDYPAVNSDITVIGTFETYEENGKTYCRLKDAELIA